MLRTPSTGCYAETPLCCCALFLPARAIRPLAPADSVVCPHIPSSAVLFLLHRSIFSLVYSPSLANMQFKTLALAAAVGLGSAVAQRPSNTSICDYYTTALLEENNATNQMTLLTLVVNTAVIGNYSAGAKNAVTGILNPGIYNGTQINLLPYFDGGLNSTNMGGMSGVSVNFLDDGGAVPLMMNKPANGTSSNQ